MVSCSNIYKSYGQLEVLKGVSLEIEKGEVVCIVGPSGAGKSTLLHIMGTLDQPDKGEVIINGQNILALKEAGLADFRNQSLGFVFQFHHLLPEFNAIENVCIPAFIAGKPEQASKTKAAELLDFLGLKERLKHKPSELSGGEQQRVAVARALINDPQLILADEPTGNLDTENSHEMHQLFFELRDKFNQTFIIVTHNTELANMADRKIKLIDGQLA